MMDAVELPANIRREEDEVERRGEEPASVHGGRRGMPPVAGRATARGFADVAARRIPDQGSPVQREKKREGGTTIEAPCAGRAKQSPPGTAWCVPLRTKERRLSPLTRTGGKLKGLNGIQMVRLPPLFRGGRLGNRIVRVQRAF